MRMVRECLSLERDDFDVTSSVKLGALSFNALSLHHSHRANIGQFGTSRTLLQVGEPPSCAL
jgi:hypothetical protein